MDMNQSNKAGEFTKEALQEAIDRIRGKSESVKPPFTPMKQRITKEQLEELTEEQMKILAIEWTPELGDHCVDMLNGYPKVYYVTDIKNISKPHLKNVPLLSIGQMIEYLQDSKKQLYLQGEHFYSPDLCDILWEEVKVTLPKGDS